jgi:hypothetical protein
MFRLKREIYLAKQPHLLLMSPSSDLNDVFAFLAVADKLEGKNRIEAATKVRGTVGCRNVSTLASNQYLRYPYLSLVAVL